MNRLKGFWLDTGSWQGDVPISDDATLTPDALLKIADCSCEEIQCRTSRCGSRQSNFACLVFYNNNNNNRFTQAHNSLTVNVLGALCSPLKQSIIVQKDGF